MQGSSFIPVGSIIAYYGDLNKIPSNFKYCNGTKGTPDLRGRTIIETGVYNDAYNNTIYSLGNTGGERYHLLTMSELPSHIFETYHAEFKYGESHGISYPVASDQNDGILENKYKTNTLGSNQAHNIMQPYMALHYIMKVK